MKLFAAAIFAFFAISAQADDKIDWSTVVPVTELPGFWDGREVRPVNFRNGKIRSGRIVGG